MIGKDIEALCIFCVEAVVCSTSYAERHFESVYNDIGNQTEEEQRELISSQLG